MKIGIFGGTFDPPHNGHVGALKAFLEQFELDCVYVIPTCLPPHKSLKSAVSAEQRLEMSFLAFGNLAENVIISDLEIKRQGKSYTADTIRHFKDQGVDDIYFLCGTDMLLTLDRWYKPDYILSNARIVFARRENEEENTEKIAKQIKAYREKFATEFFELKVGITEVSSTEIREKVSKGEYGLLPPLVAEYIENKGLYRVR